MIAIKNAKKDGKSERNQFFDRIHLSDGLRQAGFLNPDVYRLLHNGETMSFSFRFKEHLKRVPVPRAKYRAQK